jgi:GntP family gluconate:H+ symporter
MDSGGGMGRILARGRDCTPLPCHHKELWDVSPLGLLAVALLIVIGGVLVLRLHPFVVLITAAFAVALLAPRLPGGESSAGEIVAQGFGKTTLDVGIVIALASMLGACLAAAGGARRIVASIQRCMGERNTPLALLLAAFVLGIPMFAETVFYLLLPLARAAWERTGRGYLVCLLAIVAGGTMTHSLVPPTPGPLFVADALGVDMATMIGVGLAVGLVAALAGYAYARWADGRWPLDPQPAPQSAPAEAAADSPSDASAITSADTTAPARLPPLWAALVPIVLPILLISLESAARAAPEAFPATVRTVLGIVGEKNLALAGAALVAAVLLVSMEQNLGSLRRTLAEAVTEAGSIILVIGAGGALGATLRQAGLAELSAGFAGGSGFALIPAAWLVTALVRVAQGSATVAMITAAGVMAPLVAQGDASIHPVYVAIAIGCGSKVGMWMNDSGFWVVARMSGMSEVQTLRTEKKVTATKSGHSGKGSARSFPRFGDCHLFPTPNTKLSRCPTRPALSDAASSAAS